MFDPSLLTLGQVFSTIRDLSIVSVLIGGVWKARGLYEEGAVFLKRCSRHMDIMEVSMNLMLTNHLSHIEKDLAKLTGRDPEVK
jgi:hypothetical protein